MPKHVAGFAGTGTVCCECQYMFIGFLYDVPLRDELYKKEIADVYLTSPSSSSKYV